MYRQTRDRRFQALSTAACTTIAALSLLLSAQATASPIGDDYRIELRAPSYLGSALRTFGSGPQPFAPTPIGEVFVTDDVVSATGVETVSLTFCDGIDAEFNCRGLPSRPSPSLRRDGFYDLAILGLDWGGTDPATVDPGSLSIEFFDFSLGPVLFPPFVDVFRFDVFGDGTEAVPLDLSLGFEVIDTPFLGTEGAGFTVSFDVRHAAAVPAPSAVLLLSLGLGLLALRRKA